MGGEGEGGREENDFESYRSKHLDAWPVIMLFNAEVCKVQDNIDGFDSLPFLCRNFMKQRHCLLQMKALQLDDVFPCNCSVQPCEVERS